MRDVLGGHLSALLVLRWRCRYCSMFFLLISSRALRAYKHIFYEDSEACEPATSTLGQSKWKSDADELKWVMLLRGIGPA